MRQPVCKIGLKHKGAQTTFKMFKMQIRIMLHVHTSAFKVLVLKCRTRENLTGLWSGSQSVEGSLLISDVNFFRCPGFMTPIAVRSFNGEHTWSRQDFSKTTEGEFLFPFSMQTIGCARLTFAHGLRVVRNMLLWIISRECPLPSGLLTSYQCSCFNTHTHTHAQ